MRLPWSQLRVKSQESRTKTEKKHRLFILVPGSLPSLQVLLKRNLRWDAVLRAVISVLCLR
jgi:hypothetical protein